jgi:serine O-acetyltransferase
MERDPAVRTSPDVILYFKGFQALQTHRVAHWLWNSGRSTLALFVQSRANTGAID